MRYRFHPTQAFLACTCAVFAACGRETACWMQDLDDADPFARRLAAAALGASAPSEAGLAVRALLQHLGDGDPHVQRALVGALAAVGPTALPELIDELGQGDFSELPQSAALETLVRRARHAFLSELCAHVRRAPDFDPARLDPVLRPLGDDAVAPLAELLSEADERTRARAARLLARLDADLSPAVPALCSAAVAGADEAGASLELRSAALAALARASADPRAQAALRRASADRDPRVRAVADINARIAAMFGRLSASDPTVHERALEEIAALGEEGLRALITELADPDPWKARIAVRGLNLLVEKPPDELEPTLNALAAHAADPKPDLRALAWLARARGEPFDEAEVEGCMAALDDPVPAVRICAALGLAAQRGGARAALPRLKKLALDDPEPLVRQVAEHAQQRVAQP